MELEILDFDLRATLEDTTDILAIKAQEKQIEMVCIIDPDVPAFLRGDPGRLRQILINLAGNAVKFTHQGGVTIQVSLLEETEPHARLHFAIKDTGIGIPLDRIPILFSPFTQVDGSTTRKYGGTGLGLAISRQLTELMGGSIGVESELGKGSTFWFIIEFEKQPANLPRLAEIPADIQGTKILVVDDYEANRMLVSTLLKRWGCRYVEAADAQEALTLLQQASLDQDPFRIAILDYQLPGMDGADLGRQIKANQQIQSTHLVMMSSLGQRGDAARLKQIGFSGFLTKPVRQSQLYECLRLVLGRTIHTTQQTTTELITRHTIAEMKKHNFRILLAEDNPTNQLVALKILEKLGYRANAVANGQEAITTLRDIPYDLVLMDCQMPEMDGFEASRRIRSGETGTLNIQTPIIAMTAYALQGDKERCLQAGMSDYLTKPVEPARLAEMLEKWLDRNPSPDQQMEQESSSIQAEFDAKDLEIENINKDQQNTVQLNKTDLERFDRQDFLKRIMGDEALAQELIQGYMEALPEEITKLENAIAVAESHQAGELAHKIKGAAANMSCQKLRKIAADMERAGKEDDLPALQELVPRLREEFDQLIKLLMSQNT